MWSFHLSCETREVWQVIVSRQLPFRNGRPGHGDAIEQHALDFTGIVMYQASLTRRRTTFNTDYHAMFLRDWELTSVGGATRDDSNLPVADVLLNAP